MKVEIYSDVVCPWCYIGERRLARALAEFERGDEVEVVFRPYQLDPGAPTEAIPLDTYLTKRYGAQARAMQEQVSAVAETEGIEIAWDRAVSANTRTAHRLLMHAREEHGPEVQRELAERLFALHFTHGGDLGDVGQLAREAEAAGMDAERTREYLESDRGTEALDAELDRAREMGIRAVPTFVFDGRAALQGAHPLPAFLAALSGMAREASAAGKAGGA